MDKSSGFKNSDLLAFPEATIPTPGEFGSPDFGNWILNRKSPLLPGVVEKMGDKDKVIVDRTSRFAGLNLIVTPLGDINSSDTGDRSSGEPVGLPVVDPDKLLFRALLSWRDGSRVFIQSVEEGSPIRFSPVYELTSFHFGLSYSGPSDSVSSAGEGFGNGRETFLADYRLVLTTMSSYRRHCDQIVTANSDSRNDAT